MDIFYKQAHENLRNIERHVMHAKSMLDLFREYKSENTRQNLIDVLNIINVLNKWIISNAGQIDLTRFNNDQN